MARASRRVVITGIGIASPYGVGTTAFSDGLSEGRSAFRPFEDRLALVPPGVGAELDLPRKDFKDWFDPRVLRLATMTRQTQLGCIAAGDLLKRLDRVPDGRLHPDKGAFLGSFIVPPDFAKQARAVSILSHRPDGADTGWVLDDARLAEAMKFASAFDFLRALPNMPSSHLSIQTGFQGPTCTYLGSDASGLQAIGMAVQVLKSGQADAMIAGGAFCGFQEAHLAWQAQRGLWGNSELAAEERVRPYSRRTGTLPGEGAAVFYLEERAAAEARGARILAEITGYGQRFVAPGDPDAIDVRTEALRAALPEGTPDWLGPTALGHAALDRLDAQGHLRAFGADLRSAAAVAVTPTLGFSGPATGPLQLAAVLLAARGELRAGRGLDVEAAPGCEALHGAFGRTARTGPGATAVVSCFSLDGVHAALALSVSA